jgi:hypothetical protein
VGVVSREHRALDDAVQHAHCFPFFTLQVAEQQYKRIVSEAESKFINVLTSDRAPQHRSLESSSKSQQYSKRLHRSKPPFLLYVSILELNRFCSIDLTQARQCGLSLPSASTADADVIKLLLAPRNCSFSGACSRVKLASAHRPFKSPFPPLKLIRVQLPTCLQRQTKYQAPTSISRCTATTRLF